MNIFPKFQKILRALCFYFEIWFKLVRKYIVCTLGAQSEVGREKISEISEISEISLEPEILRKPFLPWEIQKYNFFRSGVDVGRGSRMDWPGKKHSVKNIYFFVCNACFEISPARSEIFRFFGRFSENTENREAKPQPEHPEGRAWWSKRLAIRRQHARCALET